jgi:PHD/YefM family antitoxin component YafN of YafNO toxin-antitoxin module
MVRLDDIQSLTEFQRNARALIKHLKRTGRPRVLTVNGQAELVVQDAWSYQKLLDRADAAAQRERLRASIAAYSAGQVRDMDDVLDRLETRHLGKVPGRGKRRPR